VISTEIIAGTPDVLEVPVIVGGPSRTRTVDPLIKSRRMGVSSFSALRVTAATADPASDSPSLQRTRTDSNLALDSKRSALTRQPARGCVNHRWSSASRYSVDFRSSTETRSTSLSFRQCDSPRTQK
jgi:hypothetical protein